VAALNTWSEVSGGGITDVAVSASETPAGIYLVGKGIDDKGIYLNRYDPNSDNWSGWSEVPGGGRTDAPIAAGGTGYINDGVFVLNLFVKGLDDHIYWNPVRL
jgi:hypothetical protein